MPPSTTISEKDFTAKILEFARLSGWRTAHFHDSRREVRPGVFVGDSAATGFPDLVLVRGRRILFCELKVGKNQLTQEQVNWGTALANVAVDCEHVGWFVWRPEDWNQIENMLKRERRKAVS